VAQEIEQIGPDCGDEESSGVSTYGTKNPNGIKKVTLNHWNSNLNK